MNAIAVCPRPLSTFARALSEALARLADDLDGLEAPSPPALADPATIEEVTDEPPERPEDAVRGPRQREIVALPGLAEEGGMKTSEIAAAVGIDTPNAYLTLKGLSGSGVVELIPNKQPQHWRLTHRYRATASPYLRMAGLVRPGEWSTYGDISIAVRGDTKAARAVARAASTMPTFPNPHRVLRDKGVIAPDWRDDEGKGPEECRRRLVEENVRFLEDGRADPTQRVSWDVLVERAEAEEAGAEEGDTG